MADPTVVRGPWPAPLRGPAAIPTGTGKGWKAMWTASGDALHRELLAELRRNGWRGNDIAEVICNAADQVRADIPPEANNGITESCIAFAAWCDAFAPGAGLRGLEHMLDLRAAARWGDGG